MAREGDGGLNHGTTGCVTVADAMKTLKTMQTQRITDPTR